MNFFITVLLGIAKMKISVQARVREMCNRSAEWLNAGVTGGNPRLQCGVGRIIKSPAPGDKKDAREKQNLLG
jgi:hypothetical protein